MTSRKLLNMKGLYDSYSCYLLCGEFSALAGWVRSDRRVGICLATHTKDTSGSGEWASCGATLAA